MDKLDRHQRDEAFWYASKVICAYYDAGVKPTVAHLRENWQANHYKDATDEYLNEIIERMGKFYE